MQHFSPAPFSQQIFSQNYKKVMSEIYHIQQKLQKYQFSNSLKFLDSIVYTKTSISDPTIALQKEQQELSLQQHEEHLRPETAIKIQNSPVKRERVLSAFTTRRRQPQSRTYKLLSQELNKSRPSTRQAVRTTLAHTTQKQRKSEMVNVNAPHSKHFMQIDSLRSKKEISSTTNTNIKLHTKGIYRTLQQNRLELIQEALDPQLYQDMRPFFKDPPKPPKPQPINNNSNTYQIQQLL